MGYLEEAIDQARAWDAERPRSQQVELGWSGLAGCRSYMGFVLSEEWASDEEDTWRAIVGTVLHEWLADVRRASLHPDISFEVPIVYGGIRGHADEVDYRNAEITDYKFPRLASVRVWDDPAVLDERFIQVQGYAAGVMETERWRKRLPVSHMTNETQSLVADRKPLVRMLVAPVDGRYEDWRCYERPFDRKAADQALERLADVRRAQAEGLGLPKDKPYAYCEKVCEFFSLCRGGDRPDTESREITDPELAAAVERYGLASEQETAAAAMKKDLLPLIKGLRGNARGFRVSLTKRGAGKFVYDERAIERAYRRRGVEVPLRPSAGRPPAIRVSREK